MTPAEAGNLAAFEVGLHAVAKGWTPDEIERLLFLAYLHRTGRLAS
jgi:hypothetical protein